MVWNLIRKINQFSFMPLRHLSYVLFCISLSLITVFDLAFAGMRIGFQEYAYADNLSDAKHSLDDASARLALTEENLNTISSQCEALNEEINNIQAQIYETLNKVMESQAAVLQGRQSLGEIASYEYKNKEITSLIDVVFGASSLEDLLKNIYYINNIENYYQQKIRYQQQLKDDFLSLSNSLNEQKNSQVEKWNELQASLEAASELVQSAKADLALSEDDFQRLSSVESQLQSQAATTGQNAMLNGDESSQNNDETINNQDFSDGMSSSQNQESGALQSSASSDNSQWFTGIASAYGGSSDPYTPNPGITATGEICDDVSMGVAIPMSLPNYRNYLGKTVEIQYGGMTVYAIVNDCGDMGGGTRVLDLQPGVFKAFGFNTCQAWGLRTVSYRFL